MTGLETILVVDVETTGLDPRECAILEIGAAPLLEPDDSFSMRCRMWAGASWTDGAARVHGWTAEECNAPSLPSEAQAIETFIHWLELKYEDGPRLMLAGMNPRFDREFLIEAATRSFRHTKLSRWFSHRTLDMHSLAVAECHRRNPVADLDWLHTDGIYDLLGMDPEPKPHRALVGARLEADAIRRLLGVNIEGTIK